MLFGLSPINWYLVQSIRARTFTCGYCEDKVSSDRGYRIGSQPDGSGEQKGGVYICPSCKGPTFITPNFEQYPGVTFGNRVKNVPNEVDILYEEARRCVASNCYTAAVMLCRKVLMNISVAQGAVAGLKFIEYVEYLSSMGYIPPNGKQWVDYIRKKGNEANHEITIMNADDAQKLIIFIEMLLKFIYEFPNMITPSTV